MTDSRGLVVVKLGGTTISEQRPVLQELVEVARERPLVLVHGGGKRLSEWLERVGVETRWEDGLRVTDEASLEVAVAVLRGVVNTELVAALSALGLDAVGLSGVDGGLLQGRRIAGLGRVVSADSVRRHVLDTLLESGVTPVIAPLALDEEAAVCNVNADDAAGALAAGLGASTLVLLTDVDGVRGADGERISALTDIEARDLIERGVVSSGMVPKVRAALGGLAGGGTTSVIADGSVPRALRRALDDNQFGTRIRVPLPEGARVGN